MYGTFKYARQIPFNTSPNHGSLTFSSSTGGHVTFAVQKA